MKIESYFYPSNNLKEAAVSLTTDIDQKDFCYLRIMKDGVYIVINSYEEFVRLLKSIEAAHIYIKANTREGKNATKETNTTNSKQETKDS